MSSETTILVVDDEIEMRIALQKSLEKCGYKVELAHNVETALNKLSVSSYNLILTDMTMPKQSGMEILNYIQKENINLPVIMITAHGTITIAVEAMKKGAFDFVEKPFNFDTLVFLVERALLDKTNRKEREIKRFFYKVKSNPDFFYSLYCLMVKFCREQNCNHNSTGKLIFSF